MRMSMHEQIQGLIDKFHSKVDTDENLKKDIAHLVKTFNIDLGEERYSMRMKDSRIYEFNDELIDDADVTLKTSVENFQALLDGTLRPMRAYVLKKVTIKGKLDDLMFLKKLF